MKTLRPLLPVLLLLGGAAVRAGGPSAPASAAAPAPAEERLPPGMRRYFLVLLIRTPKWGEGTKEERAADFAGHFANMSRMAKAGKLVLAGPFEKGADNDGEYAGLFLLTVDTLAEVRAEIGQDPTIRNGRFTPRILPWLGAEGVTTPELQRLLGENAPPPASGPAARP